jgi:endoglucanase
MSSAEDRAEWEVFKQRFVSGDGRVIDTGNGGVSHSEGQGWGLLFAVAFDDPACFDSLLAWTSRSLTRPNDALHAWRYQPLAANKVPDRNNATDGDLFIAAALWRAARRWGRPDHAQAARAIARDVLGLLVREAGPRLVLLPGAQGFANGGQLTVNPSYYVFPMLDELAVLLPSPIWARLHADGLQLLADGRFGQWRLPPDWMRVDRATGALSPHPNWPARFSYDAIRVPLYLAWGSKSPSVAAESFAAYWSTRQPAPPAWVDLNTNATANYAAPPGMIAVARIATQAAQSDGKMRLPGGFPALRASPDYYSAALILLSRLAWLESRNV